VPPLPSQPQPQPQSQDRDLAHLDRLADLLDNRFRVPGTDIRFGLDGIIGLVPYVGDMAGLAISGYLFTIMMRYGGGPVLMLRMLGNILLDALVGAIPLLGDLFDFGFKANRRNVTMLQRYYAQNPNPPRATASLAWLGLLSLVVLGFAIWAIWKLIAAVWGAMMQ
jgi:hypothetical protein